MSETYIYTRGRGKRSPTLTDPANMVPLPVASGRQGARLNGRRGYSLVMVAVSLATLLALVGLAIDIGRLYIIKSETQSFTDSASLAATAYLATNPGAYTAAAAVAAQTSKKWDFGTRSFTSVTTTFSINENGPWVASPSSSDYKFASVTATVAVPLYFLPATGGTTSARFAGPSKDQPLLAMLLTGTTAAVAAQANAGQKLTTAMAGGVFPFSPVSRANTLPDDTTDPFGYKVGNTYTLRWGAQGGGTYSNCDGGLDDSSGVALGGSFRGYCCESGNSASGLEKAILLGSGTVPVSVGQSFPPLETPGQKSSVNISTFIDYDTDTTSVTFAQYKSGGRGNGKRLVIVPVNDHGSTVAGFAEFFLQPASYYPKTPASKASWCGEYVGTAVQGVPGLPPGTGSGVYHLKLYK